MKRSRDAVAEMGDGEMSGADRFAAKSRVPGEAAGHPHGIAHVLSSQPRLWQLRKREEAL